MLTIAIAAVARATRSGGTAVLPGTSVVLARALRFEDQTDGSVRVLDARGAVVEVLAPGTSGFIRGTLRAVARGRRMRGLTAEQPMTLARWSDGRITLDDSLTGQHVELSAFGGTNAAAFAELLGSR